MAIGIFHRRSAEDRREDAERDAGRDDARERREDAREAASERRADTRPAPATRYATGTRYGDSDEPDRTPEATPEPDRTEPEPIHRAHTSLAATLSLIFGVTAVVTALTGQLAPVAVLAGVLGLVFAAIGWSVVSRRHVTGHHVVLLGLLFSFFGVVFGILAVNNALPWLNGDADQAGQFRDWLNSQMPWLERW